MRPGCTAQARKRGHLRSCGGACNEGREKNSHQPLAHETRPFAELAETVGTAATRRTASSGNFSASLSHQSGLSVLTLRSKIQHGRAMPACARRAARSNSYLRPLLTPPYWGTRQYRGESVSNERRCCRGTPCTCQVRILACTSRAYTHGPQLQRAGSTSDSGQNSLCPSPRPRAPARCHSGGSSQVARCLPPLAVSAAARPPGRPQARTSPAGRAARGRGRPEMGGLYGLDVCRDLPASAALG